MGPEGGVAGGDELLDFLGGEGAAVEDASVVVAVAPVAPLYYRTPVRKCAFRYAAVISLVPSAENAIVTHCGVPAWARRSSTRSLCRFVGWLADAGRTDGRCFAGVPLMAVRSGRGFSAGAMITIGCNCHCINQKTVQRLGALASGIRASSSTAVAKLGGRN